MARGKFELDLLRDSSGDAVVVTGATVTVLVEGTGVPADLYDDITGISGPGNPFTVTGSTIEFFADQDNRYRLDITTTSGFSRTLRYRSVTIDTTDIKSYADSQIASHSAETDNVHGVGSGDSVESVSGAQEKADAVQTNLTSHINSATPHPNQTLDFEQITYPTAYQIGSPTHIDTLQEWINHALSAGIMHGGTITDNGDGTVSIDSGYATLRASEDPHLPLYAISFDASGPLALTDSAENYIYLDYNLGSPQFAVSTSRSAFNCIDKCLAYYIYRAGTKLNIIDAKEQNVDSNRKARQLFLKFSKFIHASGGTVLGSSGLSLTVTAGEFFYILESVPHEAFDTSVAGTGNQNIFSLWYRDGIGGWTETIESKTIDTTVYDNDTGTPVAISNNKYGVSWVYIVHDSPSNLHVVMGQADYATVAEAELANPPPELPGVIGAHGSLVGFVVYLKSAVTFAEVLSAFVQQFTSNTATTHNGLSGLQGGAVDEYYHFTNTEHTAYGYHTRTRTTASPNITVPVHSLTAAGAETNIDFAAAPKGSGSFVLSIPDNTATGGNKRGDYSVDLQLNRDSADQVASGMGAFTAGRRCKASGNGSSSIGYYCTSSGVGSFTHGSRATDRSAYSKYVHASSRFSIDGDAQSGRQMLFLETTGATASILTATGQSTVTTAVVPVIPDNHAYSIIATVVARDASTGDTASWSIKGAAKRGAGEATTALIGTPSIETIAMDSGALAWSVDLVVSTTRGSAEIQVTGEVATTIHWVCKFETVEVG